MKMKNILTLFVCVIVLVGSLVGCTNAIANTQSDITTVIDDTKSKINSEMFSDRDMQSSYDEDKSITINMIENEENIENDKIKKITSSKKATKKFYEELENERKRKNEKFSGRRYANKK